MTIRSLKTNPFFYQCLSLISATDIWGPTSGSSPASVHPASHLGGYKTPCSSSWDAAAALLTSEQVPIRHDSLLTL